MKFFKRQPPRTAQVTPAHEKGCGMQRPTLFSHLSEHDLSQLYHAATIKHFQNDQCVVREGDACNCLYVILDGQVKVTYKNSLHTRILHGGDCFGNVDTQQNNINACSVIAVEHATVMEMNYSMVDHLPDNVQLTVYKKFSMFAVQNACYLSMHSDRANVINTELTKYIQHAKSQTDTFITSEVFQNIIKNIPKLPKCAGSLSAKLLDDNISAKEITESVQEEPALAAAILKTVNSAYYGLTEKISSLHHAILYLGLNTVYQLILENSIKNIMPQDDEYEKIRLHSYMISLIAGEIASHCHKSKPLVNITVGILHDVGKIVILLLKKKYPNIKELINMIDDSKVGACLLSNWEFPKNIVRIVECQYDPAFTNAEDVDQEFKHEIAILYLSHRCYALMVDEDNTATIFIDNFMELLGIQQKDCQTFYQHVILPALLKHKERLPDNLSGLLHEQAFGKRSIR